MNILTFDTEEWYTTKAYHAANSEQYKVFDRYLNSILDLLDETKCKATFFCVGGLATDFPEVVKSIADKGRQYTTAEWEQLLSKNGIRISMDGRGRCKDNIWIERFWRSIKQEYVYLHPTDSVKELRTGIDKWIRFYNYVRPHQGLKGNIPSLVYQKAA